jgi:hypothetical protein
MGGAFLDQLSDLAPQEWLYPMTLPTEIKLGNEL